MLKLIVGLALIAFTFGVSIPMDKEPFIVGGQTASPGQFPYQASLRTFANSHFCGGFIINNRWVGSAAHCTEGRSQLNMVVVVGAHHRILGGTQMGVSRVINHPEWDFFNFINDISIVQTRNEIIFSATVQPIALGSSHVTSGSAIASGWETTSYPGSAPNELQFIQLEVITNDVCRERFVPVDMDGDIHESTLCTTSPSGMGICHGDSGGPLVANNQVIGAVSWGEPCALGYPDAFMRISSFRSWFETAMAS